MYISTMNFYSYNNKRYFSKKRANSYTAQSNQFSDNRNDGSKNGVSINEGGSG